MNLRPILADLLTFIAEEIGKVGSVLHTPKNAVTPSPVKHVMNVTPPDPLVVGPFKNTPAFPLVHGTIPLIIPDPSRIVQSDQQTTLAYAILAHNSALPFGPDGLVPNPLRGTPLDNGSVIHKIDFATATKIAQAIIATTKNEIDLVFAIGQIAIESVFDPLAENGNFQGSNKEKTLDGYDLGLCQLKDRYVIGAHVTNPNGVQWIVTTAEEARTVSLDPVTALPIFVQKLAGLLAWADKTIPQLSSNINPKFRNRYYLAAGAYNFGENGVLSEIASGGDLAHCAHVASLSGSFARILALPNPFAP
jgi:hypothetical protein